jgi:beta-RFAP synthase
MSDADLTAQDGSVCVRAPGRLHFGLLALPDTAHTTHWADVGGRPSVPRRHFGGAGLMVQQPDLELSVRRARDWSAKGPQAERLLAAGALLRRLPGPCEVTILRAAPQHAGLGSGTQLFLAAARGAYHVHGLREPDVEQLAVLLDRGRRSAIGLHGFFHGGFLLEGGQGSHSHLGRLIARTPFPQDWSIVIILPRGPQGLHGPGELDAFTELLQGGIDSLQTDAMCRLVVLGLLPALEEHDLPAFGEALHDYNRRAGEMFRTVQGGTYAHPITAEIVEFLRQERIAGVGQSSWGPATFAIVAEEQGSWVQEALRRRFELAPDEVICTRADNDGARFC